MHLLKLQLQQLMCVYAECRRFMSVFLSRLSHVKDLSTSCTHQLLLALDLVLSLPGQLLLGYYGLHPLSLQPGRLLLHPPPLLLQPHGPFQLLLKLYRTKSDKNRSCTVQGEKLTTLTFFSCILVLF